MPKYDIISDVVDEETQTSDGDSDVRSRLMLIGAAMFLVVAAVMHRSTTGAAAITNNDNAALILSLTHSSTADAEPLTLKQPQAESLLDLPLTCIDQEFPNKLNQIISGKDDLRTPKSLHPAFYGCFDWHSSVHGHWSLVRLLKTFPDIQKRDVIIDRLQSHITEDNIRGELAYFANPESETFERMYGWVWLLKLAEELHNWDDPAAKTLEENLHPLTDLIVEKVEAFLPKLVYPIRNGMHTNTAFALGMVYDYAESVGHVSLRELVVKRSKEYYLSDVGCPMTWEPSGHDFLSPCLEEADLIRRVLDEKELIDWLESFLPKLASSDFELQPAIVSDRSDGLLVHLDGLNYSRAWCLKGLAEASPKLGHLNAIANNHIEHSLPELVNGHYQGGHWLGSFALMSLTN
mmetsp:Transcript_16447/g.39364  ORF Transcript_16447/g.39364 Transcript_16447/m.39364 type:complete len:406 (-) Transcript_16447:112-1329(-)